MAKILIRTKHISENDWHIARKKGVGASESAAAMGISKYKSQRQLYLEKLDKTQKFEGNYRTKLGLFLEPFLKKLYEEKTNRKLRKRNVIFQHSKHNFMLCNLDYWDIQENVPVELKTTSNLNFQNWQDETPPDYFWQCQHQMEIMSVPYMYLAVYFFLPAKFEIFKIDAIKRSQQNMIELENIFWKMVLNKIEPGLSAADIDFVKNRYSEYDDTPIQIASDFLEIFQRRFEIQSFIKNYEYERSEIDVKIKDALKNHQLGFCDYFKILWKRPTDEMKQIFDENSFMKENPELYKKYLINSKTKTREYFSVSKNGKNIIK